MPDAGFVVEYSQEPSSTFASSLKFVAFSSVHPAVYIGISVHVSVVFIAGKSLSPNIQFPSVDSLLHNTSNDVTDGAPPGQDNINDATPFSIVALTSAGSVCAPKNNTSIGSLFADTADTNTLFSSIFEMVKKTSDDVSVSILKCETNSAQYVVASGSTGSPGSPSSQGVPP